MRKLHERLSDLLSEHGIKQSALARTLGIAAPTVNEWLKSDGSKPADVYLVRLVHEMLALSPDAKAALVAELLVLSQAQRLFDDKRWTEWTARDPGANQIAAAALQLLERVPSRRQTPGRKTSGRTLEDFPESFYPLVIVEGDKREQSESRISAADFGAVTASPAEARWLAQLQLREDVEWLTDKVVILENIAQLRKRFGRRNLLIVGSPASNHLARRLHLGKPLPGWRRAAPIFRFNIPQDVLMEVEDFLESLAPLNQKQLVGKQADPATERQVKQWIRFMFTGGVFCPTGGDDLRAIDMRPNRDFGLITLARNPFADSDEFVSILVSGFHMMATAHAIRLLSEPTNFEHHPMGGVIRVRLDEQQPFGLRFDGSTAEWDTEEKSNYTVAQLEGDLQRLHKLERAPRGHVGLSEFRECLEFLKEL
jgi:hypothetical protein